MDFSQLENFKITELKKFAKSIDIDISGLEKRDIIDELTKALRTYERYKYKQENKYERMEQLGKSGKDGTTYLVKNKKGEMYAMKTFKKSKTSESIVCEATLQKMAAKEGVAPEVIEVDAMFNYIVMKKMDVHLIDLMKKQNGELTKTQQNDIIRLYKKLDNAGVFHGDSNILNYMYCDKKLYLIDYGMSKEISPKLIKKLGTDKPNINIMLIGFILKLKELNCPSSSYTYLVPYVSDENREKFKL
jgi:tRNA A-37 threonylcarbamoyl transferase component Bud32